MCDVISIAIPSSGLWIILLNRFDGGKISVACLGFDILPPVIET